jgi:23S rRNA (cytosine1962-C5)-methyltransferase
MSNYNILTTPPSQDYELLDSGDGEKLERYGKYVVARPDPQALWEKSLPEAEWKKADAVFSRDAKNTGWTFKNNLPERWKIMFGELNFWIKPTSFKHTGIFPEQLPNWEWMREVIKEQGTKNKEQARVLNLFGYTGGASLACADAGAEVCHVDGSKVAISWARENAEISGLKDKPIRWILDDAFAFVKREVKRGNKYDGIIMDPPAFGHGPKKEMWKIEVNFLPFLKTCFELLTPEPLFFLVNGYASGYSALAYENNLHFLTQKYGGKIEVGELTIAQKNGKVLLPAGIFARWCKTN